jgi:hypothetical protein
MQKHRSKMRPRQFAPPIFAASLLLTAALAPFNAIGRWGFLTVAGSYLLANLVASAVTARRTDWRLFPLLVVAFAILHLSYGFGFLRGLIAFRGRWSDRGDWKTLSPRVAE